jgi:hypothetical protein
MVGCNGRDILGHTVCCHRLHGNGKPQQNQKESAIAMLSGGADGGTVISPTQQHL